MLSNSSKLIFIYITQVIIGIAGIYTSRQGTIINSFDLLVTAIGLYVAPASLLLSLIVLHKLYPFNELKSFPLVAKILLHAISIVFISWGIFGALILTNKLLSKGEKETIQIEIISNYVRLPKTDYKYSYSYSRYYINCRNLKKNKTYFMQVNEGLYNWLIEEKRNVDISKQINLSLTKETEEFIKNNKVKLQTPKTKQSIELSIPIGGIGLWE